MRERISTHVREYLEARPGRRAPVRDVRAFVLSRGGVKNPTIYRVLDQMPEIRKRWEDRVLMAELRPAGRRETEATLPAPRAHSLYCSARDRTVLVVRRSALLGDREEEAAVPAGAGVVCLDFGPQCTGAFCPLFRVPTEEMGRRLEEAPAASAPRPSARFGRNT